MEQRNKEIKTYYAFNAQEKLEFSLKTAFTYRRKAVFVL